MKKYSIVLMAILALSMFGAIALSAKAYPVTQNPSTNPGIIEWVPGGYANYQTMLATPSALVVETWNETDTNTTIIIDGTDAWGAGIEATVLIPPGTPAESWYIFNDTHTTPPCPVIFSTITSIRQQNGTDNSEFEIWTQPWPYSWTWNQAYPLYLGQYHNSTNGSVGAAVWQPGVYTHDTPSGPYLVTEGINIAYGSQGYQFEPPSPSNLEIAINWVDALNGSRVSVPVYDLIPTTDEITGANNPAIIYVEGLDQWGNKLVEQFCITKGADFAYACNGTGYSFSTVCKVWGGVEGDSYYLFTMPTARLALFYYNILIDHVTLHPAFYDILANPSTSAGATTITVALRDIDGNLVNAALYTTPYASSTSPYITVNWYTSGGMIIPATAVSIMPDTCTETVTLTADTNPRTINVTVDLNVPPCSSTLGPGIVSGHPELNLWAYTEMTFDGVSSVPYAWGTWPIHTLMYGYTDAVGVMHGPLPVPEQPVLPPSLGGPDVVATGLQTIKLDGPIYEVQIPLEVGCNLISCPVYPIMAPGYYGTGYPTMPNNLGIPMELLFGKTAGVDFIESVWWYDGTWHVYIPGVTGPGDYFTDGVGYWIKAEKPGTIEVSGVAGENAPFTPAEYPVRASWNLVGFTSTVPLTPYQYLQSLTAGSVDFFGPIWLYSKNPNALGWFRNPGLIYPTQAFWVYYERNSLLTNPTIGP